MLKKIKTILICFDDHRGFSEEVRKRFTDASRYTVLSYPTRDEFIENIGLEKDLSFCMVAILGVHDTTEHFEFIGRLSAEVKRIAPLTGLILICPPDKIDEIKNTVRFNINAYIPKNSNTILRVHNIVKKLISEHSVGIYRKRRNLSLYLLIGFSVLALLSAVIAYINHPHYF
jgi:hypothetical protein